MHTTLVLESTLVWIQYNVDANTTVENLKYYISRLNVIRLHGHLGSLLFRLFMATALILADGRVLVLSQSANRPVMAG